MTLESAVWKALDQLPETLDETYERILVAIPAEWRDIVWRTMSLLICVCPVPLKRLITFASTTSDFQSETTEDEPSEGAFQEVMGCLITVEIAKTPNTCSCGSRCLVPLQTGYMNQHEQHARLTHYTIKESLESSRLGRSSASFYFLPSSQALAHSIKVMVKAQVSSNSRHDAPWQEISFTADLNGRGSWRSPDLAVLVRLICRDLYATTTTILLRYTPEQVASLCMHRVKLWENIPMVGWLDRDHFDKYLLLFLERCGAAFRTAVTVSILISAKVPTNPENVRVTPLQLAVCQLQVDILKACSTTGQTPTPSAAQTDGPRGGSGSSRAVKVPFS
ncbi:hypothetical protein QQZ08_010073 [Neonectria magnoliae]|uniref:Uncharacterized protein n=1 Tax=Neonectria magnoliae TaxID=2732573 RepID=A0ABR1HK87_9HYPO